MPVPNARRRVQPHNTAVHSQRQPPPPPCPLQVGGLDGYIAALKEMVFLPLVYPELFERFALTPPRGVLFYGPPGTGKTLVARALAAHASWSVRGSCVARLLPVCSSVGWHPDWGAPWPRIKGCNTCTGLPTHSRMPTPHPLHPAAPPHV